MLPYRRVCLLSRTPNAEVWEAEHPDGTRVALKLAEGDAASLVNEARSTARLHHPAIVQVLDVGVVEGRAAIVQELGGAALDEAAAGSWEEAVEVLACVLGALGHAHARGVVHRDVKPANLLTFPDLPRVRLADFGIAAQGAEGTVAGTLAYAAPEQLRGDALHPATDLYAVGCLGWCLLTGSPPFDGDADALEFAHQFSPLPAFSPCIEVPEGVEGWLRRLLEKDPLRRPRFAADATRALAELGWIPVAGWRPRARPAGLELGALREPVLHGRHVERELLLGRLRELELFDAVMLCGPDGVGKTALASWLATRAHEEGWATTARLHEGPAALVREALDARGADLELLEDRVDEALSWSEHLLPEQAGALIALAQDDHALRPAARDALLRQVLAHMARGRPLVVLLEDLEVGPEVLGGLPCEVFVVRTSREPVAGGYVLGPLPDEDATRLLEDLAPLPDAQVRRLVERGAGNPELLVLLSQDPVLPADLREAWAARLEGLLDAPEALTVAALLGVYVDGEAWEAACGRLGLALPDLEPLVRVGIVVLAPEGFRWQQRLAREGLLEGELAETYRAAVAPELLARAARWVRTGHPTAAETVLQELEGLALSPDDAVRWHALRAGVARWRGEASVPWARRAVELAETPGMRVEALHALADALAREGGDAERVREQARALAVEEGLHDELAVLATQTATRFVREGRLDEAYALTASCRDRIPEVATGPRARLELGLAWIELKRGRWEAAVQRASACRPGLEGAGMLLATYHALTYEGDGRRQLGDLVEAERCFDAAARLAERQGTWSGAIARLNQGILALQQGQVEVAGELLGRAADHFQRQDRGMVELAGRLWLLACLDGPVREACLERARTLAERVQGRDPDLLEAGDFALEAWPDPRLRALVLQLRQP